MKKLVQSLGETRLPLSVMPNAGYPVVTRARVLYQGKPAYFAREMGQIAAGGVTLDEAEHRLAEARRIPFPRARPSSSPG